VTKCEMLNYQNHDQNTNVTNLKTSFSQDSMTITT